MSRTVQQIIDLVSYNLRGRTDKNSLIIELINSALKDAVLEHDFEAAESTEDKITTANVDYVSLPTGFLSATSVCGIQPSTGTPTLVWPMFVKDRKWWNLNVVDGSGNVAVRPTVCLIDEGSSRLYFAAPSDDAYRIRIRFRKFPTVSAVTDINPYSILDNWIPEEVSAGVWLTLENVDMFKLYDARASRAMARAKKSYNSLAAKDQAMYMRPVDIGNSPNPLDGGFVTSDGRQWNPHL